MNYKERLQMINANGDPVAEAPAYYELMYKTGDKERFSANLEGAGGGMLVNITDANGRRQTVADSHLEILKTNGVFRQIKTAQCLADFIVPDAHGYSIRFYAPEDVPARGTNSYYQPQGSPFVVWTVEQPDPNTIDRIRVTKTEANATNVYEFSYSAYLRKWTYISGNGLRKESLWSLPNDAGDVVQQIREIRNAADEIVRKEVKEIHEHDWGKTIAWKTVDPEGAALTTRYTYFEEASDGLKRGLKKLQVNPDGSWIKFDYDDLGRQILKLEPIGDLQAEDANESNAVATITSYEPLDEDDHISVISNFWQSVQHFVTNIAYLAYPESGSLMIEYRKPQPISISGATYINDSCEETFSFPVDFPAPKCPMLYQRLIPHIAVVTNDFKPRTVSKYICGIPSERKYFVYKTSVNNASVQIEEKCHSPTAMYGDPNSLRTIKVFYPATNDLISAGLIHYVEFDDGRRDTYTYEWGSYAREGNGAGVFTPGEGAGIRKTVVHGTIESPDGVAYKTTREASILNEEQQVVCKEESVYTGTGYEQSGWRVNQYDAVGRSTNVLYSNGLSEQTAWTGYQKSLETDKNGVTTAFYYDALERVQARIKLGVPATDDYPAQADVATLFTYDAEGRILTETLSGGDIALVKSNEYDRAGRLIRLVDQAGLETTYRYEEGERIRTVIYPGGAERRTENYLDGRVKSVTGSAVGSSFYDYGVNEVGSKWTRIRQGSANSALWVMTTTDPLGRIVKQEKPADVAQYHYNSRGQLIRREAAGLADTLYEYDEAGKQIRSGLDLNDNGVLDHSNDRITDSEQTYAFSEDAWWKQTIQKVYPTDGISQAVTVGIKREAVGGAGCSCKANEFVSIDIRSNVVRTAMDINLAAKIATRTTTDPSSTHQSVDVTVNGLLLSQKTQTGLEYRFLYDDIGRRMAVIDPRTGTNWTHYDSQGRVDYSEDAAGNRMFFAYDQTTGRRIAVTDAMTNTTHTAYNAQGRVIAAWGATYPVAYDYDDLGRMTTLYTYRGTNEFVSFSQMASCKSQMDRTDWQYDEATGLLTNKFYADGHGTAYSYNAGRLATRSWARGITTAYLYDLSGSLTHIDYSDATPDVFFTYNRLGQPATITDVLGTRTNAYDSSTLVLTEEQASDGVTLYRNYDDLGRASGVSIGNRQSEIGHYSVSYSYDPVGRFTAISSSVDSVESVFEYSYMDRSDLLSGYEAADGLSVAYEYEPHRNVRTQVANEYNQSLISRCDYNYDAIGRRTLRIDGAATTPSRTNLFGYNLRSELVDAALGSNYFGYAYDPIGNRISAAFNTNMISYVASELNQYTQISNLQSQIVPIYDVDGNMTSYNGWTFSWDAENRLVTASNQGTVVKNAYDYMSRRIQKTVSVWDVDHWSPLADRSFLYDGWNMISETISGADLPSGRTNHYVWGLDLSGALQGAGGIGGLLCASLGGPGSPNTVFYSSDANGNIVDLTDSNGALVAHYEYDPYGNTLRAEGAEASINPYRFSSKYADEETALYYYGFRFYSPEMGRWLSRDPIQERGGLNLYRFIRNNSINAIDRLGQTEWREWVAIVMMVFSTGFGDGNGDGRPDGNLDGPEPEPPPPVQISPGIIESNTEYVVEVELFSVCSESEPSVSASDAAAAGFVLGSIWVGLQYVYPPLRAVNAVFMLIDVDTSVIGVGPCCPDA
ncbi:MAG: hypothetical protein A2X46_07540 [Lentisphaerae bacterium GWF2_57_35]|nr:MAG: hypothetical protein A2X46_07540 [Lentisphaerae bacterium GWF2_57_35]